MWLHRMTCFSPLRLCRLQKMVDKWIYNQWDKSQQQIKNSLAALAWFWKLFRNLSFMKVRLCVFSHVEFCIKSFFLPIDKEVFVQFDSALSDRVEEWEIEWIGAAITEFLWEELEIKPPFTSWFGYENSENCRLRPIFMTKLWKQFKWFKSSKQTLTFINNRLLSLESRWFSRIKEGGDRKSNKSLNWKTDPHKCSFLLDNTCIFNDTFR